MPKYSKLDDVLRKDAERGQNSFLPFFKFPEGATDIRILPACKKDDVEDWFTPVGSHYNFDPKKPIVCRSVTHWNEEDCPACLAVAEMRANGENDEAGKYSVRRQYVVRAIIRTEDEKGPQFVRLPVTLFQQIGKIIQDEDTFGDVLSVGPKGRDIRVLKTGTGLDTKYTAQALPKNCPALSTKTAVKEVVDSLTPIFGLVEIPSEATMGAIVHDVLGFSASGEDDEDEEFEEEEAEAPDEGTDDDWDDEEDEDGVGDDVPFADDDASEEAEEAEASSEDDSWLEDEDDDGDAKVSAAEEMKAARAKAKKSKTKITGLTEGLGDELGKKHTVEKTTRKRGKKRTTGA